MSLTKTVANQICLNSDSYCFWREGMNKPDATCTTCLSQAKAAIKAMRIPSREMVNAAWVDYEESPSGTLVRESSTNHSLKGMDLEDDTAYEAWVAMIDAALQEKD